MAKMKTMELESLLGRLQQTSVGSFNGQIGHHRSELMKRYLARSYGDEVQGRSAIVDTSVRDTIESIKPELMDIFMGGDRVVEFVARGEEDTEAAAQETDVCNYLFLQGNDGFMVLYQWITDALFQKTGYIKRFWDERKRTEIEEYEELTPEEAAHLLSEMEETSDKVDVLERSGGIDEETGAIEPLYLKIRRTSTEKRYTIVNVPPEEVMVHPQWTRVDFKDCPYVAHKRPVTVSEAVQMGFDRKELEALPDYDRKLDSEEALTRHAEQEYSETDLNNGDASMREVLIYENYVLVDMDDDGIAEQLQVFTGGDQGKVLKRHGKLAIEQVTDAPFEVLCPLPIPHRHYGLSVAELVQDLQRLKTVLTRQFVDNITGSNNPDVVYDEDMATEGTAKALSYKGIGRNIGIPGGLKSIGYLSTPNTAGESLAAIEYVDSLKETRTGVTRYNQGMDADSLNKTASGLKSIMSASQKKILMIARIFAETGYKSLFVNMHRDLRAGPAKKIAVKLNNDYVDVNPRTWRHRTDVTVSVGLGTGDRDVQLSRLQMIYAEQKEAYAQGMLPYKKLYHTMEKMLEMSGFKDVQNFWPSPDEVAQMMAAKQEQPQPPDINMILSQVETTKVQQKAQADLMRAEIDRMKIDNERLKTMMQDDRERDLAAAKIEADEAARVNGAVDGRALTRGQ